MQVTQQTAENIRNRVQLQSPGSPLLGLDIMSILTLIQNLMAAFQACRSSSSAVSVALGEAPESDQKLKDFVTEHYDEASQSYDNWLVSRATTRTRKDARKQAKHGQGEKLTREEARTLAIASLDEVREASDEQVQAVALECGISDPL